jgi:flagellar hook-associated protein 3 FlgL
MIGRITTQMTTANVLANINNVQDQMATTQQQISTGKRINQPSDDPYGASLAIQLKNGLQGLTTYGNNISDGTALASAADTSLQNVMGMLQRAQELTVQSANGTESATDLSATADEIDQLADGIKQEANAQYNGQYIFSGTATNTQPYSTSTGDVYQGNTAAITRQIGPGSSLQVNVDVSSVLGSGQSANDSKLLDTLRSISADMRSGTTASVADLSGKQLTNLQGSLNSLTLVQANVGATQNRLTLASDRIQGLQNSDTAALSNDQDVNMAQALTSFSTEQAAFTAALKAGADIVQSSLMDFLK